jgi:PAS domain S-box-containing protein
MEQLSPSPSLALTGAREGLLPRGLVELAMEGSGVGLWDWDIPSGRSTHSPLNKRMLGYGDADDIGTTVDDLFARLHPDDAREMFARVERYLRGEAPEYVAEFRVRRRDGSYAWFESRGLLVERGPAGEPLRMVGIHLDISDRKANEQLRRELEAALRRNQEDLHDLVRQQTRKLLEATDAAEVGNRAKRLMIASVRRELVEPLTAVLRGCEHLLERAPRVDDPALHAALEQIRRDGHELAERVKRLLDVSSIESSTLEILPTPVDLKRVIEEQCEALEPRARQRGLDLRAVNCPEDLVVFADRVRLAQVLRELLSNALRFTERGWIQVRARPFDGRVMVEVRDTGPGIAPERQATLFHAFQPALDENPGPPAGLGVGLSLCRAVISAMAGDIGVVSEPGRGSRFWFTLPLAASVDRISPTRH